MDLKRRQRSSRFILLAGAGIVFLALLRLAVTAPVVASPAPTAAAAGDSPRVLSLRIGSRSQSTILSRGAINVRAKELRGESGLVKASAAVLGAGQKPRKIGKVAGIEIEANESLPVNFPLSSKGSGLVAGCGAKTLVIRANFAPDDSDAEGGLARKARKLRIDSTGCGSGEGPGGGGGGGNPGGTPNGNVIPPAQPYDGPPIDTANSARCDFLDTAVCLQPFPNDYFTVIDESTDTDRRLNLNRDSMPANDAPAPVHIDPTDHNRNDGFSPGSMLITRVPGLQSLQAFRNTGAVPIDDLAAYDDPDQPIVLINAETGQRHPIWSEIDFNPLDQAACDPSPPLDEEGKTRLCEPDKVNLIIRPAINFDENTRYVVALRNMKNADNQTIQPSNAFRVFRDNLTTTQPAVEDRRPHMESLFATLGAAGIQRSSLYLSWDFTIASERNLSERALALRDDAFAQLGDTNLGNLTVEGDAPDFQVTSTTDYPPCSAGMSPACEEDPITEEAIEDDRIARIVEGQVSVPCYLNAPGCPPGSRFLYAPGATVPQIEGGAANMTNAAFTCIVPRSAIDPPAANPGSPSLYGHGLLGQGTEVTGGNVKAMASEHNFVFCATDWAGFSLLDVPTVLANLQDLSNFSALVDRMQQGFVNMMYLGRAMIHTDGFSGDPAFQDGGSPVINNQRLFYDGNSQGGIMSGALTALSPDFQRAVFGVPGMNYSTLLTRSVDFEPYAEGQFKDTICDEFPSPPDPFPDICDEAAPDDTDLGLYDNYPNQLERPLIFALMQILWDRGEANGYAHHITDDPLDDATDAGTPTHDVLLHPAFGDHQVANITAEVEARTIGASVYEPALDPTDTDPEEIDPDGGAPDSPRHWEADPFLGIPTISSFPFDGSALVYWDGGPLGFPGGSATPPDENIPPRPPAFGSDPHSYPRGDVKGRAQKAAFLAFNGVLRNPCTAANSPDPAPPIPYENGTFIPCHSHGWTGSP